MASKILTKKLNAAIQKTLADFKKNRLPATIIGAEHGKSKEIACSGSPPYPLAKSLEHKLTKIAPIGQIGIDNYIGCCSEVHSSNQIMVKHPHFLSPKKISFTNAIRPRTKKIISRCKNCKKVFGP